jgi:hypothetical protein
MSKHLLTDEEDAALINAATLEHLMRNPAYEGSDQGLDSWAGTLERWSWERLHPTPDGTRTAETIELADIEGMRTFLFGGNR